jgi:hypothetical protein
MRHEHRIYLMTIWCKRLNLELEAVYKDFVLHYNNSFKLLFFVFDMELVALLSSGKGTWAQVSGLMKYGEWDNIILIGDDFAKDFKHEKPFEFIKVDLNGKIKELRDEISQKLKGKISSIEVALSIASGEGKEHMALISALINFPVGIRFAALTKEGVIDL